LLLALWQWRRPARQERPVLESGPLQSGRTWLDAALPWLNAGLRRRSRLRVLAGSWELARLLRTARTLL